MKEEGTEPKASASTLRVGFQAWLHFRCCSTLTVGTVSGYTFRVLGIAARFTCLGDACAWVGSEKQQEGLVWAQVLEMAESTSSGESRAQNRSELMKRWGNWGHQETV